MLLLRVAWKLVALGRQAICASSWIVSGQLGSDSRAEDGILCCFRECILSWFFFYKL